MIVLIIIVVIVVIVAYNKLVKLRNKIDEAFSGIENSQQQKANALGEVIQAVNAAGKLDREIMTKISTLRANAIRPGLSVEDKVQAAKALDHGTKEFFMSVESYPELRSHNTIENYQRIAVELESQLSASRRFYNSSVHQYNNTIQVFPMSIIAGIFSFSKRSLFELNDHARQTIADRELGNITNDRKINF